MTDILVGYKKAMKVIDSCYNNNHLLGARNYISNFLRVNSTPADFKFNLQQFYVDDTVVKMYNELVDKLKQKEKSLLEL